MSGKVRVMDIVENVPEIIRGVMSNEELKKSKYHDLLENFQRNTNIYS